PKAEVTKENTEEPKAEVTKETFDEAWANTVVEGVNTSIHIYKTKEELTNFWKANKETIGRLKSDFPEQKKELDLIFKKYAESLNQNNEE
ncbi:MAG TPA: hypothetical protein DCS66_06675, partial [Flavobacteriaceae bacterium]|nr:hypothetical protein [Flavobacteriaceae bacterium]